MSRRGARASARLTKPSPRPNRLRRLAPGSSRFRLKRQPNSTPALAFGRPMLCQSCSTGRLAETRPRPLWAHLTRGWSPTPMPATATDHDSTTAHRSDPRATRVGLPGLNLISRAFMKRTLAILWRVANQMGQKMKSTPAKSVPNITRVRFLVPHLDGILPPPLRKAVATSLLLGMSLSANAALQVISAVPTNWRLQNYSGSVAAVYFTGSPCTSGALTFSTGSTQADANRFWSLILAAKLSNHSVFVYYDDSSAPGLCQINSFGMDG